MSKNYPETIDAVSAKFARSKAARYLGGANDPRIGEAIFGAATAVAAIFEIADSNIPFIAKQITRRVDDQFELAVAGLTRPVSE